MLSHGDVQIKNLAALIVDRTVTSEEIGIVVAADEILWQLSQHRKSEKIFSITESGHKRMPRSSTEIFSEGFVNSSLESMAVGIGDDDDLVKTCKRLISTSEARLGTEQDTQFISTHQFCEEESESDSRVCLPRDKQRLYAAVSFSNGKG